MVAGMIRLRRLCILGGVTFAGVMVIGGPSVAAVVDSPGGRPLLQPFDSTTHGIEGCAEPQFISDRLGVVGEPFALSESVGCLPRADTFSSPVIHWGDGTSSAGSIAGGQSSAGESDFVTVEGEHEYGQPGSFGISISVTDNQTGMLYEGGWHTNALISAPVAVPPPPAPAPPQHPIEPKSQTARLAAHARTISTVGGRRRREVVAMLTTNATPALLRASISWGDGAVSDGSISGAPPSLYVTGFHRWRHAGRYVVTITVTGPDGHVLSTAVGRATVRAR
jgi:hypothetical protein